MPHATALSTSDIAAEVGLLTASDYQINIFLAVRQAIQDMIGRRNPKSVVVKAVAGAGKTTTIVACTRLIPFSFKAVFLAFNKRNADDLKAKLPRHVEAATLNGMAYKIWGRFIQGRDGVWPDVDKTKINKIMKELLSPEQMEAFGEDVRFFVNMARAHGVVPQGAVNAVSVNGYSDTMDFWKAMADQYDHAISMIKLDGDTILARMNDGETLDEIYADQREYTMKVVIELVRKVLIADLAQEHVVDFDDQLYFSVVKRTANGLPIPCFKFHVVVLDEAQDINPVQRALARMILREGGVLLAVGDDKQAIYGFRGADTESINKIKAEFDAVEMPLTITYRCAKAIVDRARQVYPEIEAAPNAKDGKVVHLNDYKPDLFMPGDLIVGRNNRPLVEFAFKLLRNRIACKVLGRDIGAGIIRIIKKLATFDDDVPFLIEALTKWQEEQIAIVRAKDEFDDEGIQRVKDRYETILVFAQEAKGTTVRDVIAEVESLFAEARNPDGSPVKMDCVLLSTIHKAKGAEAHRVFFLDVGLMYPRWIMPDTWQHVQEKNLEYVAITRAMEELYYIDSNKMAA